MLAPSLLVAVGVAVALLPSVPPVRVDPEVISLVVLPPLLYSAGEELSWPELRRRRRLVSGDVMNGGLLELADLSAQSGVPA